MTPIEIAPKQGWPSSPMRPSETTNGGMVIAQQAPNSLLCWMGLGVAALGTAFLFFFLGEHATISDIAWFTFIISSGLTLSLFGLMSALRARYLYISKDEISSISKWRSAETYSIKRAEPLRLVSGVQVKIRAGGEGPASFGILIAINGGRPFKIPSFTQSESSAVIVARQIAQRCGGCQVSNNDGMILAE